MIKGHDLDWALNERKHLAKNLLKTLKINLKVKGNVPEGNYILMANHRSYLDPVLMHSQCIFLPLAKAEVSKWPIIGYGAKITGVMFVKRESQKSRRQTRKAIAVCLKDGHSVCIYPEGTTHTKPHTIEFRKGTFKIAAENGYPIIPVALDYSDMEVAFVGNDNFIPHLFRLCHKQYVDAIVSFGPPIMANDPEALLTETKRWIDNELAKWANISLV